MQFLSPLILSALALAAVPLIIHLLNRRRFQVIDWAPMKYLKLTLRTNRRRLHFEQILLLIVRTLVVALLILAVAQPVISKTGIGSLLGGRARTARIIVIDDSLSMSYRQGGRTAFERAKEAALDAIKKTGSQDSLTLRVTSSPAPLVKGDSPMTPGQLQSMVAKLTPTHAASRWAPTLKAVDDDLSAATFPVREVTIITDLRRHGWESDVTPIVDGWTAKSATVRIIDVGSRATANIRITDLRQEETVALPGSVVNISAEIRNDQPTAAPPMQAVLTIGEQSRPIMLPELPPDQATRVPLSVRFDKPGQHVVSLAIPETGDALPEDNTRWLSVHVRESLNLALLDGEPGAQPFESETDFLTLALTAGSDAWHAEHLTDPKWITSPAERTPADVLCIANLASVSAEQAAALEKLVADGMGLMIFVGDQVDAKQYNDRLYRNGASLLPVPLESVIDEPVTGLVVESLEQSPLDNLRRLAPAALARIHAKKFFAVGRAPLQRGASPLFPSPPGRGQGEGLPLSSPSSTTQPSTDNPTRILAHWNDADAHPAVIEKTFGKGKVILFTLTADRGWSDWPIDPTYVLSVRSAATLLARGSTQNSNVAVGQPLLFLFNEQAAADTGSRPLEPKITPPGNEPPQPLLYEMSPEPPAGAKLPPSLRFNSTPIAGPYRMAWKDAQSHAKGHTFAVNADATESELEPIADDQLTALMGSVKPEIVHEGVTLAGDAPKGREVWRTLITALLALMIFESILAVWVGRER